MTTDATAALSELFDRHHASLCRLGTVLLGDGAAAEEVVQEAFLRVHARWWRIRDHGRAHAYLRVTVVNLCRSRIRRRVTERRAVHAQWVEDERRASTASPEAEVSADALVLARALQELPHRQREAVVLYYYEDLSVADVAAALGCAPGTVKSQLAKARSALERALAGDGGGPVAGGRTASPAGGAASDATDASGTASDATDPGGTASDATDAGGTASDATDPGATAGGTAGDATAAGAPPGGAPCAGEQR